MLINIFNLIVSSTIAILIAVKTYNLILSSYSHKKLVKEEQL